MANQILAKKFRDRTLRFGIIMVFFPAPMLGGLRVLLHLHASRVGHRARVQENPEAGHRGPRRLPERGRSWGHVTHFDSFWCISFFMDFDASWRYQWRLQNWAFSDCDRCGYSRERTSTNCPLAYLRIVYALPLAVKWKAMNVSRNDWMCARSFRRPPSRAHSELIGKPLIKLREIMNRRLHIPSHHFFGIFKQPAVFSCEINSHWNTFYGTAYFFPP